MGNDRPVYRPRFNCAYIQTVATQSDHLLNLGNHWSINIQSEFTLIREEEEEELFILCRNLYRSAID